MYATEERHQKKLVWIKHIKKNIIEHPKMRTCVFLLELYLSHADILFVEVDVKI